MGRRSMSHQSTAAAGIADGDRNGDFEDVAAACLELARCARAASRKMALARGAAKNAWLGRSAASLVARREEILEANARDVAAAPGLGLNAAAIDRLTLNPQRIDEMARALAEITALA